METAPPPLVYWQMSLLQPLPNLAAKRVTHLEMLRQKPPPDGSMALSIALSIALTMTCLNFQSP